MALTTDIVIQSTDHETKRLWLAFKEEMGASSNAKAMEMLMKAWQDHRFVIFPRLTWDAFLQSMSEAAAREARAIAKKEVKRVLYEEGFIPTPR